jgi:hypothetical protein
MLQMQLSDGYFYLFISGSCHREKCWGYACYDRWQVPYLCHVQQDILLKAPCKIYMHRKEGEAQNPCIKVRKTE